ncbi:hypothetical protein Tco_0335003 [Tanacetum coccineum]
MPLVEMPKFNKWLSSLLRNKEKLEEIAITTVNAECSAIIMNRVPEKLEDPGKFLIPCTLQELDRTSALADSGAKVEEIKEKEDEISRDVPINIIVMPIQITFDNPIDFNDHFSKLKDLKKDLPISFDSTTTSILPHPSLDSDSPFTAELSAREVKREHASDALAFKKPSFLLPPAEPPNECLKNAVLNFYQSKKTFPLNVEEEDSFTFTIRSFLPFVTYPEVLPVSYSTGSEDKVFNPGIFDNDAFKDKSSKE